MNKNNVVVILVNVWVQITNLVINIMCVKDYLYAGFKINFVDREQCPR